MFTRRRVEELRSGGDVEGLLAALGSRNPLVTRAARAALLSAVQDLASNGHLTVLLSVVEARDGTVASAARQALVSLVADLREGGDVMGLLLIRGGRDAVVCAVATEALLALVEDLRRQGDVAGLLLALDGWGWRVSDAAKRALLTLRGAFRRYLTENLDLVTRDILARHLEADPGSDLARVVDAQVLEELGFEWMVIPREIRWDEDRCPAPDLLTGDCRCEQPHGFGRVVEEHLEVRRVLTVDVDSRDALGRSARRSSP